MKLKTNLFLAKVLNTELKYQFLKNTPKFQKSDKYSTYVAKRYLVNNVRSSIFLNLFVYGAISLTFGIAMISKKSLISTGSFTLFVLLLVLAVMNDSQFYRGLWDMKLLSPLKTLPLKVERSVIPISLFLYNEIFLPFVTIPAGIVLSIFLRTPYPFLIYTLFTVLFIYIARTISLFLGVSFARMNTNRRSKRLYLGQIFQVVMFIIFIFAIQVSTNPNLLASVKLPAYVFAIIPLTYENVVQFNYYPYVLAVTFLLAVYAAYFYLRNRNFTESSETYTDIKGNGREERITKKTPINSLISKDFKQIIRKRGAIMILVMPVAIIVPIAISLVNTGGSASIASSVPYLPAIFLIEFLLLIGLEGKAAWHLSALPIYRRTFFASKLLLIVIIGVIYYLAIMLISAISAQSSFIPLALDFPLYLLILVTIVFTGGAYITSAIPREVYSLSQEGIGGRWVMIKTFGIALPFVFINAALLAVAARVIPYLPAIVSGYALTFLFDLAVSTLFLRIFLKKGDFF